MNTHRVRPLRGVDSLHDATEADGRRMAMVNETSEREDKHELNFERGRSKTQVRVRMFVMCQMIV
jgi:hypothetical protein